MKKTFNLLIVLLLSVTSGATNIGNQQTYLHGKISDSQGKPLVGVTVFFNELKTGTITDNDGNYELDNLPRRSMLIQITAIGYKMIAENIDLKTISKKDFVLTESVVEIDEVVVTGQAGAGQLQKMPSPMSIVTHKDLLQLASTNIIDAISSQPGISQITTGSGISKPVIRGLGYNRVVVVNDGIRQEGQQWGDEHGIEIDENDVSRVEILKGPASLMYGSDAMAGIINFVSAPVLSQGSQQLNALANYQTNNGLMAYSVNFAGHKKNFVWDVRYSNKQAHAYQNKQDGYVYNSGFRENALSGLVGISSWWGYSHLTLSAYQLSPGIVEGDRDSATGKFIKQQISSDGIVGEALATSSDYLSYKQLIPFQQVKHYKAVWDNSVMLGEGSLKATMGYQQNQRQEYADVQMPNDYGLYFQLHTVNYNFQYVFPSNNGYDLSIGTNGMYQNSLNKGIEFLVPEYRLFDAGVFAMAKKTWGKINVSGGLRYDRRNETGDALYVNSDEEKTTSTDPNAMERFSLFESVFAGVSGSIGATYQLSENWQTKLNLSRGFRAPNISELGSNGVHEGTIRYELGDPSLKPENSLQLDYELGYSTQHVSARVNLFINNISNYIFSRKISSVLGGDSIANDVPVYKFNAGNARLMGGEAIIDIHPHPLNWLHFENIFSYVDAQLLHQTDSTRYLPLTPGAKLKSDLRAEIVGVGSFVKNGFVSVGIEHYFAQNKVYNAYGTETATPAYSLLSASIGGDILVNKKTVCSLYISVTNLADIAYQNHLSRLKYAAMNRVNGTSGVYNMGRNISLKLVVPVAW
ncbi:MAG: TonB-dependent receptor [Porphyromonadaceae bacterium CG2_30_38_12]|nr:MAG: TonB-dependent receptor [Porphyromonadaceae bacterium CG2_30_38_12]